MDWSRINAKRDSSRRRPLNSAIVTKESMSAIDCCRCAREQPCYNSGHINFWFSGGLGPDRSVKIERGKAPKFLLQHDEHAADGVFIYADAQSQLQRPLLSAPGTR